MAFANTDLALCRNYLPQLAETILEYLAEMLICSLDIDEINRAVKELFDSYFKVIDYAQDHLLQLELCDNFLKCLQNPLWPLAYTDEFKSGHNKNQERSVIVNEICQQQLVVLHKRLEILNEEQEKSVFAKPF